MPKIDPTTGTKKCCSCKVVFEKPYESFHKDSTRSDGLQLKCKTCKSAEENMPEQRRKRLDWQYEKYHTDEEHRQEKIDRTNHRYHSDPTVNERQRESHKEKRHNDPEYRRRWNDYNRSRERNASKDGTVTEKSLKVLYATWTGICPFCGKEASPTRDHIVPIFKDGIHSISNLQLMCGPCNSSKRIKDMEEWRDPTCVK